MIMMPVSRRVAVGGCPQLGQCSSPLSLRRWPFSTPAQKTLWGGIVTLLKRLAHCLQALVHQGLGTQEGALMHARAESVDAVIVLCGSGPRSTESALEHIAAVDDASQGVPMHQVQTHKPPSTMSCR